MESIEKCLQCQSEFDIHIAIPVTLPCSHHFCLVCLMNEYKLNKKNKCSQCQKVSNEYPNQLPKNENILSKLQQIDTVRQKLKRGVANLKKKNDVLVNINKTIIKAQTSIAYEIISLMNSILFSNGNELQAKLTEDIKAVNLSIERIESILEDNIFIKLEELDQVEIFNEQEKEAIENMGLQEINKMEEKKEKLIKLLREVFQLFSNNYVAQQNLDILRQSIAEIEQEEEKKNSSVGETWEVVMRMSQRQSKYINTFSRQKQKLLMFDIEVEEMKQVLIDQQVPFCFGSVDYQNKIYLVGGEVEQKAAKTT